LVVDEVAHRLFAGRDALAIDVDPTLQFLRAGSPPRTTTGRGPSRRRDDAFPGSQWLPTAVDEVFGGVSAARGALASTSACLRTRIRRWSSSRRCDQRFLPHLACVVGMDPKPSSSARVDERPVPNSTRPPEIKSSTAGRLGGSERDGCRALATSARRNRDACSSSSSRWRRRAPRD
jgi:hypothetical protein